MQYKSNYIILISWYDTVAVELIIEDKSNSVAYLQVWHIPIQQKTSLVACRYIFCLVGFEMFIGDIFQSKIMQAQKRQPNYKKKQPSLKT